MIIHPDIYNNYYIIFIFNEEESRCRDIKTQIICKQGSDGTSTEGQ